MLDFGDAVIHVFTAEQREYYDLESFYGAAEEVSLIFKPQALSFLHHPHCMISRILHTCSIRLANPDFDASLIVQVELPFVQELSEDMIAWNNRL